MQFVLVYLQPFRRNSVLKCALHPKIAKNSLKSSFWEVQGRSRSLKSLTPVLVMINSMYVPICNRFHIIRANNGKMTFFKGATPLWRLSSRGTSAPSGMKFCHDKLETLGQPTVKISWSYLAPFWYRSRVWQTDGRTDAQTMAKTREAFCFRV